MWKENPAFPAHIRKRMECDDSRRNKPGNWSHICHKEQGKAQKYSAWGKLCFWPVPLNTSMMPSYITASFRASNTNNQKQKYFQYTTYSLVFLWGKKQRRKNMLMTEGFRLIGIGVLGMLFETNTRWWFMKNVWLVNNGLYNSMKVLIHPSVAPPLLYSTIFLFGSINTNF